MTYCVVKGCNHATHTHHRDSKISFHSFPLDPILAEKWTRKIRLNRKEMWWKPKRYTKICSSHFEDKYKYITKTGLCKLIKSAMPTKGLHIHCIEGGHKNAVNNHCEPNNPQPQMEYQVNCAKESQNSYNTGSLKKPQTKLISQEKAKDSIFVTPRVADLRKQLAKRIVLQKKHTQQIKSLKIKAFRLKKRNLSLQKSLKDLQKKINKRNIDKDVNRKIV